jgi:hypothetical protein
MACVENTNADVFTVSRAFTVVRQFLRAKGLFRANTCK